MVGLKETYRFPMNPLNSLSSSEILRVSFLLTLGISLFASPHSSTLAWKIPWMEESGRLQSMGSLRVGHDWVTSLSLFTFKHWRRKWQPTPVFLPGESQGQEAWWAAVYGAAQSWTWLKWLSSSNSSLHWTPNLISLGWELLVVWITIPCLIGNWNSRFGLQIPGGSLVSISTFV